MVAILLALAAGQAKAEDAPDIAALRKELADLKAAQSQTNARIGAIEAALNRIAPTESPNEPVSGGTSSSPAIAASPPITGNPAAPTPARLTLGGDLRLRYEVNTGDALQRARHRWAMRGRLRASYKVRDWLTVGAQLTTGDPDDPKSSDVTMSGFVNDFQVNLDQAYLQAQFGDLQVVGGKFPNPFTRTELVWDNDFSPQGASASYNIPLGKSGALRLTGSYIALDENSRGPDSRMVGGQVRFQTALSPELRIEAAGAYYSFALDSAANASRTIDVRSNLWDPIRMEYVSDFELLDLYAALQFDGLGERWPVRLVGNYVHNYGAATSEDTGFEFDIVAGRVAQKGDWRFTYAYSQAETDAVLAAISHDSTTIATNYRQHTMAVDHMLAKGLTVSGFLYRYKPLDLLPGITNQTWQNRIRLAIMASF